MAEKPFIRVKSKVTGHEFDIHEASFDDARHDRVKGFEPAKSPRRSTLADQKPTKKTADTAVEK